MNETRLHRRDQCVWPHERALRLKLPPKSGDPRGDPRPAVASVTSSAVATSRNERFATYFSRNARRESLGNAATARSIRGERLAQSADAGPSAEPSPRAPNARPGNAAHLARNVEHPRHRARRIVYPAALPAEQHKDRLGRPIRQVGVSELPHAARVDQVYVTSQDRRQIVSPIGLCILP